MSRRIFDAVREWLCVFYQSHIHFIELHYLYIGFFIFFTSALFYSQPGTNWDYIDALFMATTSFTNTGLNTIMMSTLSTWQTIIVMLNSFFSSHIVVSYIVLMVRKHYFSKHFEDVLQFNKERRIRVENRRKERKRRKRQRGDGGDLELGLKKRTSFSSVASTPVKPVDSHSSRRQSFSSVASTPVLGVRARSPRHRSISSWMANPSAIHGFFQDMRKEHNELMDRREADAKEAASAAVTDDDMSPQLIHPFQSKYDPTTDEASVTTPHDPSLESPTQSTHIAAGNTGGGGGSGGIAFANNVEQQRENARRRFEQERRYESIMDMISRENDSPLTDTMMDSDNEDGNDDEAQFEEIMRQPIDKSQLTRKQKYLLGGVEYRALDMLSRIVPCYYLGMIIISSFFFRIYVACSSYAQHVLATSNDTGPVDPWFWSFFMGVSTLNNLGLIQLDASLAPFQSSAAPLLLAAFLIMAGNTAYAIFLRFTIWVMYKLTPYHKTYRRETLRFLLDHPRRCYTTLFPATQTWWLFIILLAITIVEIVCFLALNFWLPVLDGMNWGTRMLDGFFQSVATRNAGFSVINLSDLNPGTMLVYIVAMYISVYPVAISMRNSNVYQERSLGVFRSNQDDDIEFTDNDLRGPAPFIKLRRHPTISSVMTQSRKLLHGPDFFVLTQIQRQLSSDICWVIAGIFCICVIESASIMSPSPITMATVIYESVSAFANVGASTGYPNTSTSQAAQYHTLGKLVLILLMYRGRHRGLPSAIDRAVLLPSEQLEQQEVDDQMLKRRNTSLTNQNTFNNLMFYTRSSTL